MTKPWSAAAGLLLLLLCVPWIAAAPAPPSYAADAAGGANPPNVAGSRFLGCFADRSPPDLDGANARRDTPLDCLAFCAGQDFRFSGLQQAGRCSCGNSHGRYGTSTACKPCKDSPSESCGGRKANAITEFTGWRASPVPPNLLPPRRPGRAASSPVVVPSDSAAQASAPAASVARP